MTNSAGIHLNDYAVVAQGLERRFGEVKAVSGIDLALSRGEIYGFLGPNGAGKTTVIRMLTTLLLPTAGSAFVAGHDVLRDPQGVRLRGSCALMLKAISVNLWASWAWRDLHGKLRPVLGALVA